MTKEEIIKYVLQSPENTNPNVLMGMLEQLDSSGGDYKKELLIDSEVTQITIEENIIGLFDIPENMNEHLAPFDYVLTIYNNNEFQYIVKSEGHTYYIFDDGYSQQIVINTDENKGFIYVGEEIYNNSIQIYKLVPTSSSSNNSNISEPLTPLEPIDDGPQDLN